MKKLLSLLLILALAFVFAACNEDGEGSDNGGSPSSSESGSGNEIGENNGGAGSETENGEGATDEEANGGQAVHTHVSSHAVVENRVAATCFSAGSYDAVCYCDTCDAELSRISKTEQRLVHTYEDGFCIYCDEPKPSEGLTFASNGNGSCTVTGIGTCTDTRITVPSISPDGDVVTAIGASAFAFCTEITDVTLHDRIVTVGESAFEGCTALVRVTLSESIIRIPSKAFRDCASLASVTIPNGVTVIGSRAFEDTDALLSIIIPVSVTTIEPFAFKGSASGKSVLFERTAFWLLYDGDVPVDTLQPNALMAGQTAAAYLAFRYAEYTWQYEP